jgi:hypothetical protein
MEFPVVTGGESAQVFTPSRIVAITATVAWIPIIGDVAFCVPVDCTYKINAVDLSGSLVSGSIRGVDPDYYYTFDTSMNIEVM